MASDSAEQPSSATEQPTVAIAGATGFVGTALRHALAPRCKIIGLTRSPARARANASPNGTEAWRHCDLFDLHDVTEALEGADYAVYLVHSMHPSSRLTQASVADLDLLQADNFARAAEAQGIRQILHVGGLIPDRIALPDRLQSRKDVEDTLASGGVPVTTLRAGLIVGPGGTWLRLLVNLVRRLPIMILPAWAQAHIQPVALADVVRALRHCLGNPEAYDAVYDVGGPDRMTYREMIERAAKTLGLTRRLAMAPIDAPILSKLWIRLFSGAPWALISPLVDRMRYQAAIRPNPLQDWLLQEATPFEAALRASVDASGHPYPNPRDELRSTDDAIIRSASVARSVQRLPLPDGYTARDIANEYIRWLPTVGGPLLNCDVSYGRVVRFEVPGLSVPLLELSFAADRSPEGRQLFHVTGGWLADMDGVQNGRLEFRQALNGRCVIAAVHDFAPHLPWYVYNTTQAIAHLLVMAGFRQHLKNLCRLASNSSNESTQPALSS